MPKQKAQKAKRQPTQKKPARHVQAKAQTQQEPVRSDLMPAWNMMQESLKILWRNKRLFGGILLIYGILQLLLVQGVLRSDLTDLKKELGSEASGLGGSLTIYAYLLGSTGQTNTNESSVYQSILIIMISLAFIWALRQAYADHAVRIRDTFYKGMYPLIPFILVLFVIGLQLIPLFVGGWLYATATQNGVAVSGLEQTLWLLLFVLLAALSVYWLCSSLVALYVVTLPEMTPLAALRSARGLVKKRRWLIIRKLLFAAVVLLIVGAIILIPIIMIFAPAAVVVQFLLALLLIGTLHSYMYNLYRELLAHE